MANISAVRTLRRELLSASILHQFDGARLALYPVLAAAVFALLPNDTKAADVACVPNPSGSTIANPTETCSGAGDKINYTLPALVTSTVTLNNVVIPGTAAGTTDAVAINPGTTSQTILATGGSITAVAGNGINVTATAGNGAISIGTAANPINTPIAGGNGNLTAQGILVNARGAINVYTGNVPITGTSTGGGSWSFRVAQTLAAAVNAPVVLNSQGADVAGRGSILVRNAGTDPTDTVTVTTTGIVTGLAGAGIQTSSVNGNTIISASAPIIGSIGAGNSGISETITGTGSALLTTLSGATVTANGAATGILVSTGAGGMNVNIGANVSSAAGNAINTTNLGASQNNFVNIGAATINGLGSNGIAVIDMTTASGGVTTVTTAAGTVINSDSATTAAQNGDLAIKGTGGSIIFNNNGTLRGTVNFSAITVSINGTTINNVGSWSTTGVSTFSAGKNAIFNSGTLSINGTTTFNGLQTLNNSGVIALAGNGSIDTLLAPGTSYVSSGSALLTIDAFLGGGAQSSCVAAPGQIADCISIGNSSGTGTVVNVHDTNAGGPGQLNLAGLVVVHAASAGAHDFTLGGSNVVNTPEGPAIQKGFVQYELFFDPTQVNFVLAGVPAAAMMEVGYVRAGLQNIWQVSSDAWADRIADLRNGQADTDHTIAIWAKADYAKIERENTQSVNVVGSSVLYDTTYWQATGGIEVGADTTMRDAANGVWIFGVLGGYSSSRIRFETGGDRATPTAWNGGGYVSYFNDDLFADLLLKYDGARVNFAFPTVSGLPHGEGNSLGGKLTLGTHLTDPMWIVNIEPVVSFSYVRAELNPIVDPSATFTFGNGNSEIGTLGVHLSTKTDVTALAIQPYMFLGLNQEFSGTNPVTISSGTQTLTWEDRPVRTFATTSLGFQFLGGQPLSGFAAADGLVGGRANGWGLRLGARWVS